MSILDFNTTRAEFLDMVYSKSNSRNSVVTNKTALKRWDAFLLSIKQTDKEVLKELKENYNEPEAYLFLNKFVQFLIKQKLKSTSIKLNFTVLRSWCASNGIMLHSEFIKRFVIFPKNIKELRQPLTAEIIANLVNESPKQFKPLLVTLLSSGMRISETLQIRVKDINKTTNPIQINLRAHTTKGREERTAYISSEAWELIKPMIKNKKETDTVFTKEYNDFSLVGAEIRFSRLRSKCGYTETYSDGKRYHVNIHSFRAYFHTQATKVLSGDIAHALLGHHSYLDQYFRLTNEEKNDMYLKLEPYVTVSNEARQKTMLDDKDRQLNEMEIMKEDLKKQKAKIKRLEDSS